VRPLFASSGVALLFRRAARTIVVSSTPTLVPTQWLPKKCASAQHGTRCSRRNVRTGDLLASLRSIPRLEYQGLAELRSDRRGPDGFLRDVARSKIRATSSRYAEVTGAAPSTFRTKRGCFTLAVSMKSKRARAFQSVVPPTSRSTTSLTSRGTSKFSAVGREEGLLGAVLTV